MSGVSGLSVMKTAALLETEHAITQLPNMGAETAQEIIQVIVIVKIINHVITMILRIICLFWWILLPRFQLSTSSVTLRHLDLDVQDYIGCFEYEKLDRTFIQEWFHYSFVKALIRFIGRHKINLLLSRILFF